MNRVLLAIFAAPAVFLPVAAQVKSTREPLADTLTKALATASLTDVGSEPFHIRIKVSEPENSQSPYQGTIEQWWRSENQWRREVSGPDGMKQVIVMSDGAKSEQDTGDYFPLWLRNHVNAAFNPVPDASAWNASGGAIEQATFPNGAKSDACIRAKGQIGTGDHAVDSYSNVCFDERGRLSFYGSPRYSMEFHEYKSFGSKSYPRKFVDHPEPGTELVSVVETLEPLAEGTASDNLFASLGRDEDRFHTVAVSAALLEKLAADTPPIVWPPIQSGKIQGRLAVYISADSKGRVREVWPMNSENAGLEDPAREQVGHWQLKAAKDKAGVPVQVEGGLGFLFHTKLVDPLPTLSDKETRHLAKNEVLPEWLPKTVQPGDVFDVTVKVDERGKIIGLGFKDLPAEIQMPIHAALERWTFAPLMRGGKPQSFYGNLSFAVPPKP